MSIAQHTGLRHDTSAAPAESLVSFGLIYPEGITENKFKLIHQEQEEDRLEKTRGVRPVEGGGIKDMGRMIMMTYIREEEAST